MKTFPRWLIWLGGLILLLGVCCVGFFILAEIAGRDPAVQATGTARVERRLTGTALAFLPTATSIPATATPRPASPTPFHTATPIPTNTRVSSPTLDASPSPAPTSPPTSPPTATATFSPSPSATPTATLTPSPSPTPSSTASPTPVQTWEGVTLGMCADQVLVLHPNTESIKPPEQVGQDSEGFLVKWFYAGVELLFGRRTEAGVTCYRVLEIILVP